MQPAGSGSGRGASLWVQRNAMLCFAHGREDQWEAICLDYDIAVAGRSFEEVRAILGEAIQTYIEDARRESKPSRSALLKRRSPWHVRLKHIVRFLVAA